MGYDFELEVAGQAVSHVVHPVHDGAGGGLAIDGRVHDARLHPGLAAGEYWLELDGRRERVFAASRGGEHFIQLRGRVHRVTAIDALVRAQRAAEPSGGEERLAAPMPGTVVEIAVAAGDVVETGALLLTIESMKLETAILAPHAARVEEVCVTAGETFDQGATLVRLAAPPDADAQGERSNDAQGTAVRDPENAS